MDLSRQQALRRWILVLDGLVLVLTLPLAMKLQAMARNVVPWVRDPPSIDQLATLPLVLVPLFLLLVKAFGLDRVFEARWNRAHLLLGLGKLHLTVFICLTVLLFVTQTVLNRSLTAAYLGCTFVLLYSERALLNRWSVLQHAKGQGRARLLLVGEPSPEMDAFVARAQETSLPPFVVGLLTPSGSAAASRAGSLPQVLGTPEALERVLHTEAVDQVLFFPPLHRPAEVTPLLAQCETLGVPASFALEAPKRPVASLRVVSQFDHPFVTFDVAPKPPQALALKHFLDVVAAAVLLLLLAPLLVGVALAVLVTMGRPIFFSQERAGLFGRKFRMLKFRTMCRSAEQQREQLLSRNEMSGPVFKLEDDPRITPLGRLLRRTSIDELPQLFHVLAGEMSLVGPRPLPVREQAAIRGWHRRRLSMKPGLTGLWQVSGRSDVDFETWMKLDLEYVDRWSLEGDLRILVRTLPTVVLGRGAR